jgi:DNA polymerase-1
MTYGQTVRGLAREFRLAVDRAEALLAAHAAAYPVAAEWITAIHKQAEVDGAARTLYGRRRYLLNIYSTNLARSNEARRQAVNTIIQGTAADLIKMALVRLNLALAPEVRLLMTVHDSVLLEVPEQLIDQTRQQVIEVMQTLPPGFTVPIVADVGTGRTWAECKTTNVGCSPAA